DGSEPDKVNGLLEQFLAIVNQNRAGDQAEARRQLRSAVELAEESIGRTFPEPAPNHVRKWSNSTGRMAIAMWSNEDRPRATSEAEGFFVLGSHTVRPAQLEALRDR